MRILEKVAAATGFTQPERDLLMGEGHFLRASVYFSQARKFGRLMIVDKVLTPDDDMELSRTKTIKETYDFILKDLDEAIERLPVDVAPDVSVRELLMRLKLKFACKVQPIWMILMRREIIIHRLKRPVKACSV